MVSGSLITREYKNFRGVDFTKRQDEISLHRSPDALNVWKNYKNNNGLCIETRPDIELESEYEDTIYGLFFYTHSGVKHKLVHSGKNLYDDNRLIFSDMAERQSQSFIYNGTFYIKDGKNYLQYDGTTISEVVGYIPTTTMSKSPMGDGKTFQDANMLSGIRKNTFVADGESRTYQVDAESFDSDYTVRTWVNDKENFNFTVDSSKGQVTFSVAPPKPDTDGQDNVVIQFKKSVANAKDKIFNCTLLQVFDNRVFFSGNPDYPNMLWHSSLDDPTYCSDTDYYTEGLDEYKVKALVSNNNNLWVMKEPNETKTTIFYHTPTTTEQGRTYPSAYSSISTGCVSTGTNFNDDIVFFSERGLEAITGDITTEQYLSHRSSLIDNRLLNELKYKELMIDEYEGYLLVVVGNKIYLADSRSTFTLNKHREYDWFYWEFAEDINCTQVYEGVLYLCCGGKIYTLTKTEDLELDSYWTTYEDEFGYPQYQKTTNKKGCVIDMAGGELQVYAKIDNKDFELIDEYKNTKGYVVARIKKKKWKSIQLKFSSNEHFSLYSSTLEGYVGSYVKR